MKALKIQILLRLHGLDHVVDYLKLDVRFYDNLVLLKYRQLDSDFTNPATLECRGIILDKDNDWKIVSYPYKKFFNINEPLCPTINWDNAKIWEKKDGSLINCYFYDGFWNFQTTGSIRGDNNTTCEFLTYRELCRKCIVEMYGNTSYFFQQLNIDYNYMFEVCSPANEVVTPHTDYTLTLHGVRDMKTLELLDIDTLDTKLIKVKKYNLSSISEMSKKIKDMSWQEEGFVVFDGINMAKLKNPKYIEKHHLKTGNSPYSIISIIKDNEVDEFLSYFKSREDEIKYYVELWNETELTLSDYYNSIKDIISDKEFASTIKSYEKCFIPLFFSIRNGQIKTIHEGMCRIHNMQGNSERLNNKFWYERFKYKTNE